MNVGPTDFTGSLAEIPDAGELQHGEAVLFCNRTHFLQLFTAVLDPSLRAVGAVITVFEKVSGLHVVMENPAEVDNTSKDVDLELACDRKHIADRATAPSD